MSDPPSAEAEQWLQSWCDDHGMAKISLSLRSRLQQAIDGYLQWMQRAGPL